MNKNLRPQVAYGGKSFIEKATLPWNSIPDSIRVEPSKHSFTRNVKTCYKQHSNLSFTSQEIWRLDI